MDLIRPSFYPETNILSSKINQNWIPLKNLHYFVFIFILVNETQTFLFSYHSDYVVIRKSTHDMTLFLFLSLQCNCKVGGDVNAKIVGERKIRIFSFLLLASQVFLILFQWFSSHTLWHCRLLILICMRSAFIFETCRLCFHGLFPFFSFYLLSIQPLLQAVRIRFKKNLKFSFNKGYFYIV